MVYVKKFNQFILIIVFGLANIAFSSAKTERLQPFLLHTQSYQPSSKVMRIIKELNLDRFRQLSEKVGGFGLKKDVETTYLFFKNLQKIIPHIEAAAKYFEKPINASLIFAVLWEEQDYRDFVDEAQDTWANLLLHNQQTSMNSLSWSVGTDPWSISFGSSQMQPNTLSLMIKKRFLPADILDYVESHILAESYSQNSLKHQIMILQSLSVAPFLIGSYLENRLQKWLPFAGPEKLSKEVLATLYYLYDKPAHSNPKPSIAGSCSIQRVHTLIEGVWQSGFSNEICKARNR